MRHKMTNGRYRAIYRSKGFSVCREPPPAPGTVRHLILTGPDGEITGLPHPDDLTPEQREEEIRAFLSRNGLEEG